MRGSARRSRDCDGRTGVQVRSLARAGLSRWQISFGLGEIWNFLPGQIMKNHFSTAYQMDRKGIH